MRHQALKDVAQAMATFFGPTHQRPTWRRRGQSEGFRIVAVEPDDVHRRSRNVGEVQIPKVGWVLRWSRGLPDGMKSYRVTRDRAGRWPVAFAVIPESNPRHGRGRRPGGDRKRRPVLG
ncbi:hypothetical protein [Nonomuraea sp. NPDC049709]|uniref:hypothetical protein n=1 Tax=Nonomuraea sp. NPDC049709 TaxID=3154736 RepID=UPI0034382646